MYSYLYLKYSENPYLAKQKQVIIILLKKFFIRNSDFIQAR